LSDTLRNKPFAVSSAACAKRRCRRRSSSFVILFTLFLVDLRRGQKLSGLQNDCEPGQSENELLLIVSDREGRCRPTDYASDEKHPRSDCPGPPAVHLVVPSSGARMTDQNDVKAIQHKDYADDEQNQMQRVRERHCHGQKPIR
jgi:hypothetical protein